MPISISVAKSEQLPDLISWLANTSNSSFWEMVSSFMNGIVCVAVPQWNICNWLGFVQHNECNTVAMSEFVHLSIWNRDFRTFFLLQSFLRDADENVVFVAANAAYLIYYEIRTWLLVFQMLLAQAIISPLPMNKNAPLQWTSLRHANPELTKVQGCPKKLSSLLSNPSSLPTHSFCHFSAKFDLYTFYYICFCYPDDSRTPSLYFLCSSSFNQ